MNQYVFELFTLKWKIMKVKNLEIIYCNFKISYAEEERTGKI